MEACGRPLTSGEVSLTLLRLLGVGLEIYFSARGNCTSDIHRMFFKQTNMLSKDAANASACPLVLCFFFLLPSDQRCDVGEPLALVLLSITSIGVVFVGLLRRDKINDRFNNRRVGLLATLLNHATNHACFSDGPINHVQHRNAQCHSSRGASILRRGGEKPRYM